MGFSYSNDSMTQTKVKLSPAKKIQRHQQNCKISPEKGSKTPTKLKLSPAKKVQRHQQN